MEDTAYQGQRTEVSLVNKGSVITDVKLDTGEVIHHMIIPCNIEKTYGISRGSKIWLRGRVGVYKAVGKDKENDYCIEDITHIKVIK